MFLGTLRCYERVFCSGRRGNLRFFAALPNGAFSTRRPDWNDENLSWEALQRAYGESTRAVGEMDQRPGWDEPVLERSRPKPAQKPWRAAGHHRTKSGGM